jgi:RNA polymerase sigma-70 factor (ECF subfamily)
MNTDPDMQLMLAFQAGNQRAFQDLFDKYKKRVINYCFRFCGHRTVAEELAQETFLKVYKAARHYRPKARFSTWLFKIATNVCLNEIRRPAYRNRLESLDQMVENAAGSAAEKQDGFQQHNPDDLLVSKEQQQMVRQALDRLPDKQRAALLLRVEGEFSYAEIGQQINRSENHVKTLIHRGRKQLKMALAAYFGDSHAQSM